MPGGAGQAAPKNQDQPVRTAEANQPRLIQLAQPRAARAPALTSAAQRGQPQRALAHERRLPNSPAVGSLDEPADPASEPRAALAPSGAVSSSVPDPIAYLPPARRRRQ
eukprot:41047-Chlamydomonas_euryale.AAC.2